MPRRLLRSLAPLLFCLPLPALAQSPSAEWQAYEEALSQGARQANLWQLSWTGIYAGSLAWNAWQASEGDDADERFDARVGTVKSAIALGGLLLDRQPHPAAYRRLREGAGDLDDARRLIQAVAEEERRRRGWRARLGSLAVNGVAGLAIGVGDDRPEDGAINFATGMLVGELQLRTQPGQALAAVNRFQPARLSLGDLTLEGEYAWVITPERLGVVLRY
ncbi:hypothetical protein ACFPTY_16010 [Halomonas beimenensis]|uniref:Uncharacterized protein n=1 Tax=Halomonas beimenensis TaxID=475662 RepID=A0A291PCC0_9GAMM|nr:hypothetical protein [Halomonas beimenensis]ATJ84522.1 hypothetical protein BEI_3535 [Halomonas beimenensis]